MNNRSLGALIALNLVLLIALAVVGLSPAPVQAQAARPGEYVMVSGEVVGSQQAVIYIVELRSSRILACRYDWASKNFTAFDGRTLNDDLAGRR